MSILAQGVRGTEYCMVDLETTGLDAAHDGIVEIAAVRFNGAGKIQAEFHSLINPGMPVQATEIHGITDADVADAPTLAEVAPAVLPLLNGAVVLAYNASFDLAFLRYAWGLDAYPFACAMYFRGLVGMEPSRYSLAKACADQGIAQTGAHCAGDDAHAARAIFLQYLTRADELACHTFGALASRKSYKFTTSWRQPLLQVPPVAGQAWAKPRYHAQALPPPSARPAQSVRSVAAVASPPPPATPEALHFEGRRTYLRALAEVLDDFEITDAELVTLQGIIARYHLTARDVREVNYELVGRAAMSVLSDGILEPAEAQGLLRLAAALGTLQAA